MLELAITELEDRNAYFEQLKNQLEQERERLEQELKQIKQPQLDDDFYAGIGSELSAEDWEAYHAEANDNPDNYWQDEF